jgi:hypothetical protein
LLKKGQEGEQVAREEVLTAMGPVLALPETGERWNNREESFMGRKEGKERKKERERIKQGENWP